MAIPVIAILSTVALALGVVSAGINFKTIYEIEMDRHILAATEQQLAEQYGAIEEKLEEARWQNNAIAAAEYETMLNDILLIRNRSNVAAIGRQVEQRKAAFIADQWSIFQANLATDIVSWGVGKIGFGKVTDSYMRSRNWPPGGSFVTWNPASGQAERFILGSSPELVGVEFSDELGDFMSAILNGFDVARSITANESIQVASDASAFVSDELGEAEGLRPLPADIGDYLAASLVKKVKRENPQIATESLVEQAVFVRQQACQQLKDMYLNEQRDQHRVEALRAALDKLECDQLAAAAPAADESSAEAPADSAEAPPAPPESIPTTEEPAPPPEAVTTTVEPAPPSESSSAPGDPCDFMPPGIPITQKDQGQCVGEYSVEPYIAVTIAVLDEGTNTQTVCKSLGKDGYSLIMEEVNLGECGFKLLFSHFGEVDASSYDGWGTEFLLDRMMVNVYTFDVYPNSEGWIQATALDIEERILSHVAP